MKLREQNIMLVNKVKQSIKINIPSKYHIVDTYSCLYNGGLTCSEGFTWNGSNLITNNNRNKRGSMFHDCLYDYIIAGYLPSKYRKVADKMYRDVIVEDGTSKVYAWLQWIGIRLTGWLWTI